MNHSYRKEEYENAVEDSRIEIQMRNVALMSKRNPKDENLAVEDRKMTKQFLKDLGDYK